MTSLARVLFRTFEGGVASTRVELGGALSTRPEWSFLDVAAALDEDAGDFCGSSGFSYDTFQFQAADLVLVGVAFAVPDGATSLEVAAAWWNAPATAGVLRLEASGAFGVERVDAHAYLETEDVLVAIIAEAPPPEARLALGNGVSLLVGAGEYCGWLLENATACLVSGYRSAVPVHPLQSDPTARRAVSDLLGLTSADAAAKLARKDEDLRRRMSALRTRVEQEGHVVPNGALEIVAEHITALLDDA